MICLLVMISYDTEAQVNRYTNIQFTGPTYQYQPVQAPVKQYKYIQSNDIPNSYNSMLQTYKDGYVEGYKYGYRDGQNSNILLPCAIGAIHPPSNGQYTYGNGYSMGYRKGYSAGRRDDPYK